MQSPLLGFNNNVKHRGRLFHIQTEDSGIRHPHVITHLFMDGGRILKTVKTSYSQHLGSDRLSETVRELMKGQHKTMFIALRDGQFDYVLDGDDAPPPSAVGPASLLPGQFEPTPSQPGAKISITGMPAATGQVPPLPGSKPLAPAMPPMRTAASGTAGTAGRVTSQVDGKSGSRPSQRREAPDIFAGKTAEAAAVEVVAEQNVRESSFPKKAEPREKPSSGRYAASRPAAIFAGGRNPEAGGSIFGDDLISEKSLDEVILSYLSEDLETSSPKK
jgi:hypothetical protein